MNRKWLAVIIILLIALFAVSWLLPKTPSQATGFEDPGVAARVERVAAVERSATSSNERQLRVSA